jgi:hypothetical protein
MEKDHLKEKPERGPRRVPREPHHNIDKQMLEKLYVFEGRTGSDVAAALGVSKDVVYRA